MEVKLEARRIFILEAVCADACAHWYHMYYRFPVLMKCHHHDTVRTARAEPAVHETVKTADASEETLAATVSTESNPPLLLNKEMSQFSFSFDTQDIFPGDMHGRFDEVLLKPVKLHGENTRFIKAFANVGIDIGVLSEDVNKTGVWLVSSDIDLRRTADGEYFIYVYRFLTDKREKTHIATVPLNPQTKVELVGEPGDYVVLINDRVKLNAYCDAATMALHQTIVDHCKFDKKTPPSSVIGTKKVLQMCSNLPCTFKSPLTLRDPLSRNIKASNDPAFMQAMSNQLNAFKERKISGGTDPQLLQKLFNMHILQTEAHDQSK